MCYFSCLGWENLNDLLSKCKSVFQLSFCLILCHQQEQISCRCIYLWAVTCPRSDGKGTAISSLQHECNTGPFDVRTPCGKHAGRARVAKHRSNLWPTDTWHTQLRNQPKRCRLTPSCPLQTRGTETSPEEPTAISAGHLAASGYQLSACCLLCWGTQFKWDMRQNWRGTN